MRLLFVVNVDWFFISHRLPIALEAQKKGFEVHIATCITDRLDILLSYGFKVYPLEMVRSGFGILNSFKIMCSLIYIIKSIAPDVVHLVTIKPVLLGGMVARLLRVPAVVSAVSGLGYVFIANGVVAWFRRWFVIHLYKLALRHSNQAIIFQNNDDRDYLLSAIGFAIPTVVVIRGSGVDLSKFTVIPEANGMPIVLFPSRLLADKGVYEFIEAVTLLREKNVYARFVLVGMIDSANPTSLSKIEIEHWVNRGLVEYWGHREDMPEVIANASIVVLPSYREGFPKVLIEAAASGRAVITTDVPGCRDALVSGETGLLVPVRNSVSLTMAINLLLANKDQRAAMGLAGRRLAEREFNVTDVVQKHIKIYQNLIGLS